MGTWKMVKTGKHRCAPSALGAGQPGDIWECDCGRRWKYVAPGNPAYEGWRMTVPTAWGFHRHGVGDPAQRDGPKLLLPGECPHETTFLKVRPDGWACRDCGAAIPAQRDGRIAPMPGGGDTVFGVPSRHGRENFPPASGTDTPLVASGEPNESDSSEKRHNDGRDPLGEATRDVGP